MGDVVLLWPPDQPPRLIPSAKTAPAGSLHRAQKSGAGAVFGADDAHGDGFGEVATADKRPSAAIVRPFDKNAHQRRTDRSTAGGAPHDAA